MGRNVGASAWDEGAVRFPSSHAKFVLVKKLERWPVEVLREGADRAAAFLRRDRRVRLVYVFGSVACPTSKFARDLDLAILCVPSPSLDELMRLRADVIAEARCPVDLVSLGAASVVLAKEVADTGRCLFAASPDIEVEFVTRARARYWDFKPFLEEQWRSAGRRAEERSRGSQA
jgi:predicted nucleotidyltransferase